MARERVVNSSSFLLIFFLFVVLRLLTVSVTVTSYNGSCLRLRLAVDKLEQVKYLNKVVIKLPGVVSDFLLRFSAV